MLRATYLFDAALFVALTASTAKPNDLTVEVHPQRATVALGEPVLVSATVVNGGTELATLMHHNAPALQQKLSVVDLMFRAYPDQFNRWDDRLRPTRRTTPRVIPPGERITIDLVMLFNSQDGFFAIKPGTYFIQGRIVAEEAGEILSPPVQIEIREPAPSDKAAWDWLNAHKEEYGRLVQVPWEAKLSDDFLNECENVCEKAPTAYSEYLAYFLSRWYSEGPGKTKENAKEKSARFAEIAKARATSDKIRAEADKLLSAREAPPSP